MAEQLICNQQVDGSTPFTSSNLATYGGFPEWPKGADCKSVVNDFGGPNPPSPTNKKALASAGAFLLVLRTGDGVRTFFCGSATNVVRKCGERRLQACLQEPRRISFPKGTHPPLDYRLDLSFLLVRNGSSDAICGSATNVVRFLSVSHCPRGPRSEPVSFGVLVGLLVCASGKSHASAKPASRPVFC